MKHLYLFYIETDEGLRIEWNSLTEDEAKKMYRTTSTSMPKGVKRFGWEELK